MNTNLPSLWKQLLGALAGAGVALLLYGGYSTVAPHLTAWVVAPQAYIDARQPGGVRTNSQVSDYEYSRFVARSQAIYRQFGAAPAQASASSQTAVAAIPAPPPPVAAGTGTATQVRVRERMERIQAPAPVVMPPERADQLPGSGIGVWLGIALAGLGAAGLMVRRRMKHLSVS